MNVISLKHIWKKYFLNQPKNLKGALLSLLPSQRKNREEFWALQDVSFEVEKGEMLGLIGPNGAGKSTILKLLSGITVPTKGSLEIHGRIGALINLGAGFHPELTGRENIYLYGSIMGLTRNEIQASFQKILDFSELEKFIDTPVKRYSSGMFVRLGFSTAIHINPDILLIDEVLAVGDFRFRDKCTMKIQELRKQGTTMILVSHQRPLVERLCQRAIFLQGGTIHAIGETSQALESYIRTTLSKEAGSSAYRYNVPDTIDDEQRTLRIKKIILLNEKRMPQQLFSPGDKLSVQVYFQVYQEVHSPIIYARLFQESYTEEGVFLHGTNTDRFQLDSHFKSGECGIAEIQYKGLHLLDGKYFINVGVLKSIFSKYSYDQVERAASFTIKDDVQHGTGTVHLAHEWRISKEHHA